MAAYILLATKPKMLILMAVDENVNIAVLEGGIAICIHIGGKDYGGADAFAFSSFLVLCLALVMCFTDHAQ